MEKVRYMISDAANIVNVESHVLRYWEEELALDIPRNEMGHRYYTNENIKEFQRIKDLKEKGYQLKAIRMIVHNGDVVANTLDAAADAAVDAAKAKAVESTVVTAPKTQPPAEVPRGESPQSILDNTDKMAQFTDLMTQIVGQALAANNQQLSKNIGEEVGEQVIKEMNYLMREREEAEEERFRKLDEAIRENLRKKGGRKSAKENRPEEKDTRTYPWKRKKA